MGTAGLRPLGLGEILDVAIKLYKSSFVPLIKAVAVVSVPVQVVSTLVLNSATSNLSALTTTDQLGNTTVHVDAAQLWTALAAFVVVGLLSLLAAQVASAACFKIVAGRYLDEQATWQESLRFGVSRLRSLVWLALLSGVLTALATLALLVPGIYLYGAWAVAVPALLLEDKRGRKALGRSRGS